MEGLCALCLLFCSVQAQFYKDMSNIRQMFKRAMQPSQVKTGPVTPDAVSRLKVYGCELLVSSSLSFMMRRLDQELCSSPKRTWFVDTAVVTQA